jgi:hypothetical protein
MNSGKYFIVPYTEASTNTVRAMQITCAKAAYMGLLLNRKASKQGLVFPYRSSVCTLSWLFLYKLCNMGRLVGKLAAMLGACCFCCVQPLYLLPVFILTFF